jgi:ribonuclease R
VSPRRRGPARPRPKRVETVTGILQGHPDGFGFVVPDQDPSPDRQDVYVPAHAMGEAMHGDRVEAQIEHREPRQTRGRPRDRERRQGRILRVLEHAHRQVVGRLARGPAFAFVTPPTPASAAT